MTSGQCDFLSPSPSLGFGYRIQLDLNSRLWADNWLFLDIVIKGTCEVVPKKEEPGITEPIAGSIDGEILGLWTITITCLTR